MGDGEDEFYYRTAGQSELGMVLRQSIPDLCLVCARPVDWPDGVFRFIFRNGPGTFPQLLDLRVVLFSSAGSGLLFVKAFVFALVSQPLMLDSLKTILNSWYNFCFMLTMVSAFLLLYWMGKGKIQKILVPYGRMSLTDYIMQSVIGSFLYFGYGLALHQYCGTTVSLLVGIVFFLLQLAFPIGGSGISNAVRWKPFGTS